MLSANPLVQLLRSWIAMLKLDDCLCFQYLDLKVPEEPALLLGAPKHISQTSSEALSCRIDLAKLCKKFAKIKVP